MVLDLDVVLQSGLVKMAVCFCSQ